MIRVSVIIPTHAPNPARLHRTLDGLRAQTLSNANWELLVVDNASPTPVSLPANILADISARIIPEPDLGLTSARRRGFAEAKGEICVLVDDDNVLAPNYLCDVLSRFATNPTIAAIGGPSRPEFEEAPAQWLSEFFPLLALRDLGPEPLVARLQQSPAGHWEYPPGAPIGAGLALRTSLAKAWAQAREKSTITDRQGARLTSGGDNDIVLYILRAGHACAYFPELELTHLIPASRLDPKYLARLNRGIQFSWMQILTLHGANPWEPLTALGARLRTMRAWFSYRAWKHPSCNIRWSGAAGHFAGRVPKASRP